MTFRSRTISTSILHMRNESLCRLNKSPKTAGLGNSRLGPGTWSVCLQILVFSHECCKCSYSGALSSPWIILVWLLGKFLFPTLSIETFFHVKQAYPEWVANMFTIARAPCLGSVLIFASFCLWGKHRAKIDSKCMVMGMLLPSVIGYAPWSGIRLIDWFKIVVFHVDGAQKIGAESIWYFLFFYTLLFELYR